MYRKRFDVAHGLAPTTPVVDAGLKLVNLELTGTGRYAVRLYGPKQAEWSKRPLMAVEYFWVGRVP